MVDVVAVLQQMPAASGSIQIQDLTDRTVELAHIFRAALQALGFDYRNTDDGSGYFEVRLAP